MTASPGPVEIFFPFFQKDLIEIFRAFEDSQFWPLLSGDGPHLPGSVLRSIYTGSGPALHGLSRLRPGS